MAGSTQPVPCQLDRVIEKRLSCAYLLHRPAGLPDAAEAGEKWPLLLFLHGAGERGHDLTRVRRNGPLAVLGEVAIPPMIIVAPQCPPEQTWDNDILFALLDEIEATQPVDPDRVYVTGVSMGGFGTWSMALADPTRFAAIVPICGGAFPYIAYRLKRLPIWAFHGALDDVVPLYESERMVDAIRRAGGDPRLTVYPDAAHDAWTPTYRNRELYDWLLAHRRERTRDS